MTNKQEIDRDIKLELIQDIYNHGFAVVITDGKYFQLDEEEK